MPKHTADVQGRDIPSILDDTADVHVHSEPSTGSHTAATPSPQTAVERETAGHADADAGSSPPETFPRAYVENLRAENAEQRVKARRVDDLARELFTLRVAALGRLADPTDLPYSEELLDTDQPGLEAAVDELLARKPHLADRRPSGDIDQGARPTPDSVDLAGMLRARAG